MAVFSVLNGTGINGNGVQFGTLSSIASSGIAGNPNINATSGTINFVSGGKLSLTGTGMSFNPPATFGGTVDSMTYAKPPATPIFSITGMSIRAGDPGRAGHGRRRERHSRRHFLR